MPSISEIRQYLGGQTFGKPILPDVNLTGKTYIVIGANTGLGFESAKQLASLHASKVILGCRNTQKGEAAKAKILEAYPKTEVEMWQVDLSDFSSVLEFGRKMEGMERVDGFIANAGIETVEFEMAEGFESSLTINVISTFLLSISALPKLKETARFTGEHTNLVIVGSMQHIFAPDKQLQVLNQTSIFKLLSDPKTADMSKRYELTKLMVQQLEKELAERLGKDKNQVVVNCVNPGWCATELSRYYDKGKAVAAIFSMIGRSAEDGGKTLVHAVTAGWETHGKYLSECMVKNESQFVGSEQGKKVQRRLWRDLEEEIERLAPEVVKFVG